jgi:pyruvate formate lyase activating enzyme
MAAFLGPLSGRGAKARLRVDVLPYHQLGQSKYRKLGLAYPLDGQRAPERAEMEAAAAILAAAGLEPRVGG